MAHDALHALAALRTQKERGAAATVAQRVHVLQQREEAMRDAERAHWAIPDEREGSSDECQVQEAFRERVKLAMEAARVRMDEARRAVEEARQVHSAARIQRRVVERVMEHRAEERATVERRAEQRELDELFILNWGNRKAG